MPVRADNWSQKAIRRKTTGTGRMRYMKDLPRRFKNGFREGALMVRSLRCPPGQGCTGSREALCLVVTLWRALYHALPCVLGMVILAPGQKVSVYNWVLKSRYNVSNNAYTTLQVCKLRRRLQQHRKAKREEVASRGARP